MELEDKSDGVKKFRFAHSKFSGQVGNLSKYGGGSRYLASNLERSSYSINGEGIKEEIVEVMASGEIEVKKEMIPFHQEAILAAPIFVEDKTDQDIMERGLNINDVEVMRYENKVTLDPGPEKAVPLQPAYPESGEIKGCNSIEEDFQSGCENESSSNNKTGNLGLEDKFVLLLS